VRKTLATAAILACAGSPVCAQQIHQLNCQGTIANFGAVLSGVRMFTPYNALGDGFVRFNGSVSAGGRTGRMIYEGCTRTAPFEGIIETPQGTWRIKVLDNTNGQMKIYDGKESLGAPPIVGNLGCSWR